MKKVTLFYTSGGNAIIEGKGRRINNIMMLAKYDGKQLVKILRRKGVTLWK